jgi:acetolactate synthase-1/2/3 large subunit
MNFGELNTIASLNLPIKVIILNNFGDAMVRNLQILLTGVGRARH